MDAASPRVVIDEPDAILRCMNKVFLHELLSHHKLPTPKTRVLHREGARDSSGRLRCWCPETNRRATLRRREAEACDAHSVGRPVGTWATGPGGTPFRFRHRGSSGSRSLVTSYVNNVKRYVAKL